MTSAVTMTPPLPIDPAATAESPVSTGPLPVLRTRHEAAEIARLLDAAARRGSMPGFHPGSSASAGFASPDGLFTVTDFGRPFESILIATARQAGDQIELSFATRMKPLWPAIFAAVLVLTVWPGVWLTDSLLRSYFGWYTWPEWVTWAWYIPLSLPAVPLGMRAALRRSRASGLAEAHELVGKIARHLDAQTLPQASPRG